MSTWESNIARDEQQWACFAVIVGVGHGLSSSDLTASGNDGRTRFCSAIPSYASTEPAILWRPLLTEFPDPVPQRADELGGAEEMGSVTFRVLDEDNYLTGLLRTERAPTTALTSAVLPGTTTFDVGSSAGIVVNDVVFMSDEAMLVTGVPTGTSVQVSRGYLGTAARSHGIGDRIFLSTPIGETRRLEYYMVPLDGDSSAERRLVGTFVVDSFEFDEDANVWVIKATSQSKPFARLIPHKPTAFLIESVREGAEEGRGKVYFTSPRDDGRLSDYARTLVDLRQWFDDDDLFFLACEKEVFTLVADGVVANSTVTTGRRDVLGSGLTKLEAGKLVRWVFVADAFSNSFRYSPGPTPATSRSAGTWTRTQHWIDLLLILMTSSADPDDALELQNYVSARGNFSSLPAGYGLSYPAADIDWDAFFAVRQRTPEYIFPKFCLGLDEPMPFGQFVETQFLKPMGGFISVELGLAKIVLPRMPLLESSTLTLGPENILSRKVGKDVYRPRFKLRRSESALASSMSYLLGPQRYPVVVSNGDFARTFGGRNIFSDRGKPIAIPVPGASPAQAPLFYERAQSRLFQSHRPRLIAEGDFDMTAWDWVVGGLAAITIPEVVNFRDATRGWTSYQCQLRERKPTLEGMRDGGGVGAYMAIRAQAYGPEAKVGRICPAAVCTGGGGFIWTFAANRYTHSDAVDDLPTSDAAAFQIGDICRLVDEAGVEDGSSGTETIVDIVGNDIELTGDFNGNLGIGGILIFAGADDVTSDQLARFAFMSDRATQTVGATGAPAYVYGES